MPENQAIQSKKIQAGWRFVVRIASAFILLVGMFLVASDLHNREEDPLNSAQLKNLKARLRSSPANENLKTAVRNMDLQLRTNYFNHLVKRNSGVYLLLGGTVLFLVSATHLEKLKRQLPMPGKPAPRAMNSSKVLAWSRRCVAAGGVVVAAILLGVGLNRGLSLPRSSGAIDRLVAGEAPTVTPMGTPSKAEFEKNWPRFRGPGGSGIASTTTPPAFWDVKSGLGIAWKALVPLPGYCSPVIWGDRVFFSGANERERMVFCLDGWTGHELWRTTLNQNNVPASAAQTSGAANDATATVATDGRRVYAFFGNGELVACNLDGKVQWSKRLGPVLNTYGHAASLLTVGEKLILQLDQGEAESNKSKLYAFDGRSGQILWQRPRQVGNSWASPIVIDVSGKQQIITLAVPALISYALSDGSEVWRVAGFNGEITPSPALAAGLVLAISPSEKLMAIRTDGAGDVSKSHVVWTTEENVPDIVSPVSDGTLVFTLTTLGLLTCMDGASGKKQWEHDFAADFHSSPTIAAGHLYLFSRKGSAIIVESARAFKEVFRTEMGDVFDATPAFAGDKLYLRGETNIWCVAATPHSEAQPPNADNRTIQSAGKAF